MTSRWTYAAAPAETPTVTVEKVAFDEIDARLGASARRVTPDERRAVIAERRRTCSGGIGSTDGSAEFRIRSDEWALSMAE